MKLLRSLFLLGLSLWTVQAMEYKLVSRCMLAREATGRLGLT